MSLCGCTCMLAFVRHSILWPGLVSRGSVCFGGHVSSCGLLLRVSLGA